MQYRKAATAATAAIIVAGIIPGAFAQPVAAQERLAGIELAPHRAVYTLSLGRTRQGGNVAGAKGAMVMEWEKSCAGWTVKQRLKLDLADNEGNIASTESDFSSFESLDGLSYRFTNRDTRGGQVTEELQGSAKFPAIGAAGTADYSRPKGTRFDLPAGTVFPTVHMKELLAAAQKGERVVYRSVFDGATLDGPLAVNAVVGVALDKPKGAAAQEPLTNRRSWRMRLAFFPLKATKAEPDYELGLRAYDNGVSDDYVIDYGSFSVNAKLERVEALEQPKC